MVTRWPSTSPPIEHLSFASPDSRTESAAEPYSPERAMTPQQTMMNEALSPHTPSPLPADADATGTDASPPCAAPNSISEFVAPKTENQVLGGLCRIRRMSTLRSTRQDAQMNYLSTLSIFMKQTTYLATLPNPKSEANKCIYHGAVRDAGADGANVISFALGYQ
jgi:hypothetical protein